MAMVVMQDFPGSSVEQYDQVNAQVNPDNRNPKGNLFHVAGPIEGGLRVVDVWESQEALNDFMAVLGPMVQSAGLPSPQVTTWPVHNILAPGYALGG